MPGAEHGISGRERALVHAGYIQSADLRQLRWQAGDALRHTAYKLARGYLIAMTWPWVSARTRWGLLKAAISLITASTSPGLMCVM